MSHFVCYKVRARSPPRARRKSLFTKFYGNRRLWFVWCTTYVSESIRKSTMLTGWWSGHRDGVVSKSKVFVYE